ncbi:GrlR family regulatory protein [Vogesella sp. LIG4]|uniref:GrlR family regulatory protein n=1 Tax=Vogesella sp. LIG4 TaxID=1192162 RepID=UPI00081FDD5C|nr:GrlR family regulatory protein [Vogesella sp. LIG4]SCK04801.1 T3SS negative regulator,GrlR [Vogesella sp. LIG4]
MLSGIYQVRLATSDGQVSEGQWVIDEQHLNGNDHNARYQGRLLLSGEHVALRLDVQRNPESQQTLFGPASHYLLALNGHLRRDSNNFDLSGPIEQVPGVFATLSGHWVGTLD